MTKPGDLPERYSSFERPRKGVQAAVGIFRKDPVATCPFRAAEGDGFFDF